MRPPHPRPGARTRHRLVLAVAVLMVCLPALALDDGRPARLGWHMYSGVASVPEVVVRLDDGGTHPVAVQDVVARLRPEPDYAPALVRHLCDRPDVVAVTVRLDGVGEEVACTGS